MTKKNGYDPDNDIIDIHGPGMGASAEEWRNFLTQLEGMRSTYHIRLLINGVKSRIADKEKYEKELRERNAGAEDEEKG